MEMTRFGLLRNIEVCELEMIRKWRNAPEVRENMYNRHEISEEEHLMWWENKEKSTSEQYLIYVNRYDEVVGVVSFNKIDKLNANAYWGFYLSDKSRRGDGAFAECMAIEYAYNGLDLHKLNCEVFMFNSSVIKMHKKYGFIEEGVFKENHLYEGKYIDITRLGLLKDEWSNNLHRIESKLLRIIR